MSDDAQGRTLLATPVPTEQGETPDEAKITTPATDTLIGKELAGRYKIERKLGEGGMGAVYIAQHTTLEKPVAIKILHGEYARKADLIERFLQEAKSASKIRHENVIDITDFGTTQDGLVFFCMELLTGQDLHELLTRAKIEGENLPWTRTAPIFLQVCAALHAAHTAGVIHRDLKPENIFLIEWLGNPDFVKLLDFGIAKMTSVEGSEDGRKLTKTGMLFGTPEYMSPEQARGDKPDARVDVYAMGCILYQLVTGAVPFSGDSFMAVLSQHLTAEPPAVTPAQLSAVGAPPALAGVIARSLLKDRDARYQSIKELADAVRQVSSGLQLPGATGAHPVAQQPAAQQPAAPETAAAAPTPVSRRSEWTGSARLPAATAPADKPRAQPQTNTAKKLWMAIAAVVVVGGAAVAAVALTQKGGGDDGPADPTEPAVTAPGASDQDVAPQPDPVPDPASADPAPADSTPASDTRDPVKRPADEGRVATPVEPPTPDERTPGERTPNERTPDEAAESKVEQPPANKTCPKDQRWSDAKNKCVARKVETDAEIKPGEVNTKNPFDN